MTSICRCAFRKVAEAFHGHSEVDWITAPAFGRMEYRRSVPTPDRWDPCIGLDHVGWLKGYYGCPQPGVFWTRKAWQVAGPLDETYHYLLDRIFWLRFVANNLAVLEFSEPLAVMRFHLAGKMTAQSTGFAAEFVRLIAENPTRCGPEEIARARKDVRAHLVYMHFSSAQQLPGPQGILAMSGPRAAGLDGVPSRDDVALLECRETTYRKGTECVLLTGRRWR